MEKTIKSLRQITNTEIGDDIIKKFNTFSCKNNDVENFLKTKAIDFEKRNKSRTYLMIDIDTLDIMGYYTLSLKSVDFTDSVSKNIIQKIDGFSKSVKSVAVILIGQLGKNSNYAHQYDGFELLQYAIDTIYDIQDNVGGRICLIETENSPENLKVINFYKSHGFKTLQIDKTDTYLQMFRLL